MEAEINRKKKKKIRTLVLKIISLSPKHHQILGDQFKFLAYYFKGFIESCRAMGLIEIVDMSSMIWMRRVRGRVVLVSGVLARDRTWAWTNCNCRRGWGWGTSWL